MKRPICKVDRLIQAIDAWILKEEEELEEELKAEGYVAVGAAVLTMSKLEEAIINTLTENTDKLLKQLKTVASLEEFLQNIWPVVQIEKELEGALENIFQHQFPSLMEECIHSFLLEGDKVLAEEALAIDKRITKPAQEFIESWSSQLASLMQLSTNQQIEKILLDSQEKAMSIQQVAEAIATSGIRSAGYRARRVAQTEVLRIESYAQLEAMRQDPSVEEKEWMHTGAHKNKPRANHVAMNGTRVGVEEKFELEGADGSIHKPMCPRDICLPASETVNCHCIMRSIRNEEILGMSIEERRALRKKRMDEVDAEWEDKNRKKLGNTEETGTNYEGIPKTWEKLSEDADITKVNPTNNKQNCVNCTIAYEMRSRGYAVVAGDPIKKLRNNPFGGWVTPDIKIVNANEDALSIIKNNMKEWGEGSRAQIAVIWNRPSGVWGSNVGLTGHSFIAEQKNKKTIFIDVQTGTEYTDDIFKKCSDNPVEYCRIDNLETTDLGSTACKRE